MPLGYIAQNLSKKFNLVVQPVRMLLWVFWDGPGANYGEAQSATQSAAQIVK